MIRSEIRTARKSHVCDTGDHRAIAPGDRYRYSVASPGHDDLGNFNWWTLRECADCAKRYARPIPDTQTPNTKEQHK